MAVKLHPTVTDVEGAVSYGYSVLIELRDEVSEAADAIEDGFSGTSRYETLTTTRDALDGPADSEPEVYEALQGLPVTYGENRRKRQSRSDRRDEALRALEAARDAVNEFFEDHDSTEDGSDEAEQLVSDLDEAISALQEAEFPSMYA